MDNLSQQQIRKNSPGKHSNVPMTIVGKSRNTQSNKISSSSLSPILRKQSRVQVKSQDSGKVNQSIKELEELSKQLQGRRKRYHKTRKKIVDNQRHISADCSSSSLSVGGVGGGGGGPLSTTNRETRSVGGTPICLRKVSGGLIGNRNTRFVSVSSDILANFHLYNCCCCCINFPLKINSTFKFSDHDGWQISFNYV